MLYTLKVILETTDGAGKPEYFRDLLEGDLDSMRTVARLAAPIGSTVHLSVITQH